MLKIKALRIFIVPVILFLPLEFHAQEKKDSLALNNEKTKYISKMDTILSLRLNLNNEHERFVLQT